MPGGDKSLFVSVLTEESIAFQIGQEPRRVLVRNPGLRCQHPALLITLTSTTADALDHKDFRMVPDIFLAAGHRVASFDLPNHGERTNRYGEGLRGMAAAAADGVDVFADIEETGRAVIDACIERGWARAGGVVLSGVSRGGLAALHLMAADERVLACAVHCPVTYLPALREFKDLAENAVVQRGNASGLVDRLADRPVFIAIGQEDPRVGAEHAFEFHARLRAASVACPPELFIGPGISHGETYAEEVGFYAGAAFLLRHYAERAKGVPHRHLA